MVSSWVSPLKSILGVILFGVLTFSLAWLVEPQLLKLYIYTPPELTLEEWVTNFQFWASMVGLSATMAALIWCVLGEWVFVIEAAGDADKKIVWLLLTLIPLGFTVWVSLFRTFPVQTGYGQILAYFFYLINIISAYFIATACFSPPAVKYNPWGSTYFRIEAWF